MRLAGRVLTRGADGTDMPDGIKPPKRGPATEPLQPLRVSGPIRNTTDLMDRFGETLRKNLGQRDGDARSVGTGPDALSRHLNR